MTICSPKVFYLYGGYIFHKVKSGALASAGAPRFFHKITIRWGSMLYNCCLQKNVAVSSQVP